MLLYVKTEGKDDYDSAVKNPCRLSGCRGLKNMFFRGERNINRDVGGASITGVSVGTTYNWNVTICNNENANFYQEDVGREIDVSNGDSAVNGTWEILEYIDATTVVFGTNGDEPSNEQSDIGWIIDVNNAVFYYDEAFGTYGEFILDNVDFRTGGSQYSSFYIDAGGRLFVRLLNAASIRMGSFTCIGKAVVQSDGSPCWVGTFAFSGSGYVKFFVEPGMEFHDSQCISYDVYQSIIYYKPALAADWNNNVPTTIQSALDRIAAQITPVL